MIHDSAIADTIAESVRASIGNLHLRSTILAGVIGVSQRTAERRLAGTRAFTVTDVLLTARHIDVPAVSLTGLHPGEVA